MIHFNFAQKILNTLFKTDGSVGETPEQVMARLIALGIPESGYTPDLFFEAFKANGYETDIEFAKKAAKARAEVNATSWYTTENVDTEIFEYKIYDANSKDYITKYVTFSGWTIVRIPTQRYYYPENSFLALFTTMPDGYGDGYVEPATTGIKEDDETGESTESATGYMRINLHRGIINAEPCLTKATAGENGVAVLKNGLPIMFHECLVDWGKIVGFGVFNEATPRTGKPIFWGSITNGSVSASADHVPLFRKDEFQITLS